MATKRGTGSVLRELPKRVGKAQAEAEKMLARGYKATLKALPSGPRKAVREITEQLEETAEDLTRRGKRTLRAVEKSGKTLGGRFERTVSLLRKRGKGLVTRMEKTLADLERRRGRAVKAAEKRVSATVEALQQGAVEVIEPLAHRLEIATQGDVDRLSKRLAHVERKLGRRTRMAA